MMSICDALTDEVLAGAALPPALLDHARSCDRCRVVLEVDRGLAGDTDARASRTLAPSPELRAALAGDHAPVRPYSVARRLGPPLALGLALAAGVVAFVPRRDLAQQPAAPFWASAALWAAMGALGLWAMLSRGRVGLGLRPGVRWLVVAATVGLFEAGAWMLTRPVGTSLHFVGARAVQVHFVCASFGTLLAACVGALAFRAARRSAPVSPGAAGAAAGVAAGVVAALSLQLECAFAEPFHVGVAHAVPLLLGAGVGALVGRRVLAP